MWSCISRSDSEQSLLLHGLHPDQETDLHFQESPQDQIVQEEAFMDHRGCSSWGCQSQFWIKLGHAKQFGMISHSQVQQGMMFLNSPSELGSSAETPNQFFWDLKPTRSLPKAIPTVGQSCCGGGCRNIQSRVPNFIPMSQPSCSDCVSVAVVI